MAEEPNNQSSQEADESSASPETTPTPRSKVDTKVELDLDDAPFLEDDEPEPAPEPAKAPPQAREAAPPPVELSRKDRLLANKKKLIFAGGGAVVLLAAAIAVNLFLFPGDETSSSQPPALEPEKVLAAPKPLPPAPVPPFVMQWEPFWVELKDTEGAVRFLTCKFSIPTDNPTIFDEMNKKKLNHSQEHKI